MSDNTNQSTTSSTPRDEEQDIWDDMFLDPEIAAYIVEALKEKKGSGAKHDDTND